MYILSSYCAECGASLVNLSLDSQRPEIVCVYCRLSKETERLREELRKTRKEVDAWVDIAQGMTSILMSAAPSVPYEGEQLQHARAVVEELTEKVERLKRERDEARAKSEIDERQCDDMTDLAGRLVRERDEARAEVERLRSDMDAMTEKFLSLDGPEQARIPGPIFGILGKWGIDAALRGEEVQP
jgi:DNA repair exonuclease SbcCD ATPase subunit